MTDYVIGSSLAELHALILSATKTLSGAKSERWPEELASLKPFESLRSNPRKVPCALIAWYALKDSLALQFDGHGAALQALSKDETSL
jgi:NifU-like protein involved in Fe-S cluster formation